jgi:hypothetical protein
MNVASTVQLSLEIKSSCSPCVPWFLEEQVILTHLAKAKREDETLNSEELSRKHPTNNSRGNSGMTYVPYVVERSARGERVFGIYSRLLKRVVFAVGQVDDPHSQCDRGLNIVLGIGENRTKTPHNISIPGGHHLRHVDIRHHAVRKPDVNTLCAASSQHGRSIAFRRWCGRQTLCFCRIPA